MPDETPRSITCLHERFDTDVKIPEGIAMDLLSSSLSTVRVILSAMRERLLPKDDRALVLHYLGRVNEFVERIPQRMNYASKP